VRAGPLVDVSAEHQPAAGHDACYERIGVRQDENAVIPLGDDHPPRRVPVMTIALLVAMSGAWILVQGAGLELRALLTSICDLGLVPGELTRRAPLGTAVPLGGPFVCVVDRDPINWITPVTSLFLHGDWGHLLSNGLFFWVFGRNVEDAMGRARFLVFFLLCGLAAAAMQVAVSPSSPVPMVGASGAISGIMGAYLLLYPRARVDMLFIFIIILRVIPLPAWLVLLWWFGLQVLAALPQLAAQAEASAGIAFWAHVGGFVSGLLLVPLFAQRDFVEWHHTHRRLLRSRPFWHGTTR
jgi:membrane associated rhomboid family serine protease